MKNSDILEFSRYQSQQRIPKKKLATFPPSTIAASSNFLIKNLANIRTNMDTNLLADDQRLLKELFSTIASTFGSALAGIVVYSAMLFGQTLHSLFMMLIVGLTVALMITKDTAISLPNKRRRIHYLFALAFLVGLQSGKLLEFFGVEDSAHLFSLYFMNMVLFYSYTAASVYADSVKFLHLYGFLGASAFFHLLRSFVLPYTTFLRSAILFLVLGLDLAFLLFDTPLIVERWRHGKTDPLGHITAMFTDAGQISYSFILLLYQLCKQLAKQLKNDGAARAFNYGEKKRVEAKKLP